jgi:hypothetical protein
MKSSAIFLHLNLLHSPSALPQVHTHTVPILQSCLLLLISKLMFKGVSQCIPAVSILSFGLVNFLSALHVDVSPLSFPCDAGDWTLALAQARHVLYYWAMPLVLDIFFLSIPSWTQFYGFNWFSFWTSWLLFLVIGL